MFMTTDGPVPPHPTRIPSPEQPTSLTQRLRHILDVSPKEHGKMALVAGTIILIDTVLALIAVGIPRLLSGPTGILDLILGAPCFLIWWLSALILIDASTKYWNRKPGFQSLVVTLLYVGLLFTTVGIREGLIPLDQSTYLGRFLLQFIWYGVVLTLLRVIFLSRPWKKSPKKENS